MSFFRFCYCCRTQCLILITNNNLSGKQLCCYFCLSVRTSWTVRLYMHVLLRVFTLPVRSLQSCRSVRASEHTQSHWFCLFITPFFINFIWIRCRVQSMITDQTVAINMRWENDFSHLFSYGCSDVAFVFIFFLSPLFSGLLWMLTIEAKRINEITSTTNRWEPRMNERTKQHQQKNNHDHRKQKERWRNKSKHLKIKLYVAHSTGQQQKKRTRNKIENAQTGIVTVIRFEILFSRIQIEINSHKRTHFVLRSEWVFSSLVRTDCCEFQIDDWDLTGWVKWIKNSKPNRSQRICIVWDALQSIHMKKRWTSQIFIDKRKQFRCVVN